MSVFALSPLLGPTKAHNQTDFKVVGSVMGTLTRSVVERVFVIDPLDNANASRRLAEKDAPVCFAQTLAVDTEPANILIA